MSLLDYLFIYLMTTPTSCGSSWVRSTAVTFATALTHCAGLGNKPTPLQLHKMLQSGSIFFFFFFLKGSLHGV